MTKPIGEKPAGVSKEELTERLLDESALALDRSDSIARAAITALRCGAVDSAVADLELSVAYRERSRAYTDLAQRTRALPYDDATELSLELVALEREPVAGDGRVTRALREHFDPPIFGWQTGGDRRAAVAPPPRYGKSRAIADAVSRAAIARPAGPATPATPSGLAGFRSDEVVRCVIDAAEESARTGKPVDVVGEVVGPPAVRAPEAELRKIEAWAAKVERAGEGRAALMMRDNSVILALWLSEAMAEPVAVTWSASKTRISLHARSVDMTLHEYVLNV